MLKTAYVSTALIGLLIIIPLSVFVSVSCGLHFGLGLLLGIYPYVSWQIIYRFLPLGTPMSWLKKMGLIGICFIKLLFMGLLIYLVSLIQSFSPLAFISGLILPLPIILFTVLLQARQQIK